MRFSCIGDINKFPQKAQKEIKVSSDKIEEIKTPSNKITVEDKKNKKEDKVRLIDKIKEKVISTISKERNLEK